MSRLALLLCLVITATTLPAADLHFPPPGEGFDVQSRKTPQQVGLDPAVIKALERSGDRWALWRHGHLVHVEGDFNHDQDVWSNRKTWHALTVGATLQHGKIPSIDQEIGVWNKELTGKHATATWRHVITQSSGFDYPYGKFPAYEPGKMWTYSDLNPIQLCNALARVYGKKDYYDNYERVVKEAYFDAIGLRGWRLVIRKDYAFHGPNDAIRFSFDLEDMGRLGLLVLARGNWDGKQVAPQWFVEALETKQTRGMLVNYDGPNDGDLSRDPEEFPECPYGFMTWVNTDGDLHEGADRAWAYASGAGGNRTLWNHKLGIVFAVQGAGRWSREHSVPHILEAHVKE
jgi:CubicO group peptidase (beta-lactamase class C family)